jgi:nitrite reductase (NADH) small subunit
MNDLRMNERSTWIRIAYCRDIPLREGRAVKIGNREIAIFNLGDRFLAVENRCPHKGGPLADGIVSGNTVVCPLHAWKMSLETGQGVNGPSASSCVETFRTRVEGGVVQLELLGEHVQSDEDTRQALSVLCAQERGTPELIEYPSAPEA